ncbi:ribosomal-protein-serine acetyltransferase [Dysgonomonas alginatilytica]|uniref:Ribosomal-protein-serine acetyltransferase n=1 Tax=Dysgonomonas alginatilytica TaxID=1605892 RepID=A0A2V3PR46_9BACT|nr:GNAT family protein [Dysgonomonas alginatilytica]PXV63863.1 ribosomal-protein-serine acetyltransferase [Dysgonomonas alginatilytica]
MIEITGTVVLHPTTLESTSDIYQAIIRERNYLRTWLPFVDWTKDESDTLAYVQGVIDNKEVQYSIYDSDKFIGRIGFNHMDPLNHKAEIGYWIIEEAQGKGIITRSVKELLMLGFTELNLNKIVIRAAIGNTKSRNIPEKLGFTQEGIERDGELLVDNKYTDLAVYGLLKKEFKV